MVNKYSELYRMVDERTETSAVKAAIWNLRWEDIDDRLHTSETHAASTSDPHSVTHSQLSDKGTNTHADIDTHVAAANPHSGHVDTSGNETVAGIKTFSSFAVTPSSAPMTDYQTANKKYVDDNVSSGGNEYLPFEMRLGVSETNLDKIDHRQGRSGMRLYAKRVHLTADGSTSSDLYMTVQLPSWFDGSFYAGTNIWVDIYKSDADGDCSATLTVYDDGGDADDGVNGATITPTANTTWETKTDQLTETNYTAGDWITIKVSVTLVDQNDAIWIGPAYLRLN